VTPDYVVGIGFVMLLTNCGILAINWGILIYIEEQAKECKRIYVLIGAITIVALISFNLGIYNIACLCTNIK
jgi:ABC-type Fe3+ transport system permease subunit